MKTIDLRPWAVALLASVYTAVFWTFRSRLAPSGDAPPHIVWYDELPPNSRPNVPLPAGWTIARAGDPIATHRPMATRAPRIRTRSS